MPECVADRLDRYTGRPVVAACTLLAIAGMLFVLTRSAAAQDLEAIPPEAFVESPAEEGPNAASTRRAPSTSDGEPEVLHVTDRFLNSAQGRRALRAYRNALEQGAAGKAVAPAEFSVDDTTTFNVWRIDSSQYRYDVSFVLKEKSEDFYLWVEETELDSTDGEPPHVRPRDVDSLYNALENDTPSGSYDPDAGIVANNEAVFGEPGDRDNNGRVHILLTDIKDDWDGEGGAFVAGFFFPTDLDFNAEGSNRGEVLYLDTHPGIYANGEYRISTRLQSTAAHEYQHLIHAAYDASEVTFVNEGLSEWAELVNGYSPRPTQYLSSPDEVSGYNTFFYNWSSSNADAIYDYQRAGLFTQYLAERIGTLNTGMITRIGPNVIAGSGYEAAFDSAGHGDWTVSEVLGWFHTANVLNDRNVDPRFGYEADARSDLSASAQPTFDGRTESSTAPRSVTVRPGGVRYVRWTNVEDFSLTLEADTSSDENLAAKIADGPSAEKIRSWTDASVILESSGSGTVTIDSVDVQSDAQLFEGSYQRVTLVLVHRKPEFNFAGDGPAAQGAPLRYSAQWKAEKTYESSAVHYDNGDILISDTTNSKVFFTTGAEPDEMQAARFLVPEGSGVQLAKVEVPLYFRSQFGGNDLEDDAPRDFRFHIWSDTNGKPGTELYSFSASDTRTFRPVLQNDTEVRRMTVGLDSIQADLPALPDTVWVGVSEVGDDENYLVLAPSPYRSDFDGEHTSVIDIEASGVNWQYVDDLALQNGTQLSGSTLPYRAEFLVPTATGETRAELGELPESFRLGSNYPNPFNPRTQIPYELPAASDVSLTVYDALGRKTAVLVDGRQPPGRYTVTVDAGTWPSGIYVYVLRAGERVRTGKMMLLK